MSRRPIVFLDACTLYPAPLRDLLMRLTVHRLIRARWSHLVHEEWITAVLRSRPDLARAQLERTRDLMNLHAEDCLVVGFEHRIDTLELPDPNDRHVLAAAIEGQAEAVITWNLADFPEQTLDAHGLRVLTPDALLGDLLARDFDETIRVMRSHRASLKNPPRTGAQYLETLEQQGLRRTVECVRAAGADLDLPA